MAAAGDRRRADCPRRHTAGLRRCSGITTLWTPGQTRARSRPSSRSCGVATSTRRAQHPSALTVYAPRPRYAPVEDDPAGAIRGFPGDAGARPPERPRLRRLERAEPERFLALPVRRLGQRHRCARVYLSPGALLRRAEGGLAEDPRLRRLAGAARRRQSRVVAAHAVSECVHPRDGRRVPRQRTGEADHGRLCDPSVPRAFLGTRRARQHPRGTSIGIADYDKLVGLLGTAFDGTAQTGSKLPVAYTEFGVQSRIPERAQGPYTNLDSPLGQDAVDEATQASYYREALELAACQPTVIALVLLPPDRRARPEPLAVGPVLRGHEAEVEPPGDQGGR